MSIIIYNGNPLSSNQPCIKHNDRGFTLGHGLFETILINKGAMPAFDYHWHRLETSAPLISMNLPFSKEALTEMLLFLIAENNLEETIAGARITITAGESIRGIFPEARPEPNFTIFAFAFAHPAKLAYSARIVSTRKNEKTIAARIKSISYLDNILAKQEVMMQGFDEAILLNTGSNVADGAITNVFMVKNGQIYTPPIADGALPGVIRNILLKELTVKFSIIEKSITPAELLSADEVFLTNALIGIQPVSQINDKKYQCFSVGTSVAFALRELKDYI
ncbi:aminotransferase class IV [Legionella septentrionalis]|uniref:aminotransferase class IV n=1 Tax=Legionella septentrionalis TaxID=2498109 RepID=UPI000F8C6AB2|nr:aminotransferase class IV [Legionella septentrionalis]RUR08607.1 hypothetical protein ELY14_11070 [Legionella septentrionalis]